MATKGGQKGPEDPNRIDIGLNLIDSDSIQTVQSLVSGLEALKQEIASLNSLVPESQLAAAQTLAGRVGPSGIYEGGRSPNATVASNVRSWVQDAHGEGASHPEAQLRQLGESGLRDRIRDFRSLPPEEQGTGLRQRSTNFIDRQIEAYGARERYQASVRGPGGASDHYAVNTHAPHTYDQDYPGTPGNHTSGQSTGASIPQGQTRDEPEWMRALKSDPNRYNRSQEPFTIPQFGEWTVQDKLNMASDFFSRRSVRSFERARSQYVNQAVAEGESMGHSRESILAGLESPESQQAIMDAVGNAGGRGGRSAALLRMAADQSASVVAISREARRIMQYGSGIQQQGVSAGYERAGQLNIPGTDIGITNPLNALGIGIGGSGEAAREAMNQRVNVQRLRLRGGIDGTQAREIVGGLAASGWTGEEGQRLAFDTIAPLVQQGLNPETTVQQMDQAIRNGNTSVEEFRETLTDLGPSARAARMSLEEYQQSLTGFAEAAQEMGGTFGEGLRTGRSLSTGLGITPQQAGQLYQSPLLQGMAGATMGALPNELGALGANAMANNAQQTMELAMQAASGFRDHPIRDPETGEMVSGEERQIIQAASMAGIPRETFERMWRGRETGRQGTRASEMLTQYSRGRNQMDAEIRKYNKDAAPWNPFSGGDKEMDDETRDARREALETGKGLKRGTSWDAVEKQLRALAPRDKKFQDRVTDVGDLEGKDRIKEARKLIAEQTKKAGDPGEDSKVYVEFTGAAAKFFKQQKGSSYKDDARAGGKSTATTLNSPQAAAAAAQSQWGFEVP